MDAISCVRSLVPPDSVHKQMMVYASDFHFLETALHMFGVNVFTKGVQVSQSTVSSLVVTIAELGSAYQ
jgi:acyl-CoA thioesterase